MSRFLFPVFCAIAATAFAQTPETGQLDASPTLFTVMAALNSVGYSAELSSPNNHPLRDAIRAEIAKKQLSSLGPIKEFFEKHRQHTDAEELGQYVSFALTVSDPPNFKFRMRDVEIPPDVAGMKDFGPLLAAFYKEAGIADLWKRAQPAIEQYLERYHEPVSQAVLQVNTYLRQQTSGFKGRHFQIFLELQGAPNQIQTRSYGDSYTIVLTPSPEPRVFDIRHAYLHYLLDPLATRYQEILERKKPISVEAKRAPALDDSFKGDFLLLATESLIKAVEARLDHNPAGVKEALLQGHILTPFFSDELPVYEKQEQAMLFYYPDLVGAIDLKTEETRLAQVQFDKQPMVRVVKGAAAPAPPPLTGTAKTLDDAEQLYTSRNLDQAKAQYLEVLKQTEDTRLHSAAYYGLARIAALQKDPELAVKLFQKTLDLGPEPTVKAWSLVYLGRLSAAAGERDQAMQYFQSALKVEGASAATQQAATQGVQVSSK